jgi:FkbM family methyltransferase
VQLLRVMRTIYPAEAEDDLRRSFFRECTDGFFVDVGANDPERGSQTFEIERSGWSGILIEPQPGLARRLAERRRSPVFAVACSAPHRSGTVQTLYLAGGHSSFDPNLNLPDVKPHGQIEVPVRTLDETLEEAGAKRVDFVSIDVEGHELDVLAGFDLSRWKPRLIMIEDLLKDRRVHRELTHRGYCWMRRTGINNWYVPADHRSALGLFGWLQFINKFYLGTPFRRMKAARRRRTIQPRFVEQASK